MNAFLKTTIALLLLAHDTMAFVAPSSPLLASRASTSALSMMDVSTVTEASNAISTTMASSGMMLAETEAWVQPTAFVLGPFLNFMSFAMVRCMEMLCRWT